MFWIRFRFVAAATLAVGIASGGTGIYVCGSQQPASKDRQPASQPPATTTTTPRDTSKSEPDSPPILTPPATTPAPSPRAQRLATRKAKALYEIARLTRELAEIAVDEYGEVNYPRDLAKVAAEIKLAEANLRRAQDQLDWARRMYNKGYVSAAGKAEAEAALKKAVFEVEQATAGKNVLVGLVEDKTIKELKANVEKTRSDELAKEDAWIREQVKEAELEH